jgi:hypothetical protein
MKGTIIGSDFIQTQPSVKVIEINTDSAIYNDGAEMLNYDALFNVLLSNNIKELHFIYTEGKTHLPLSNSYRFEDKLKEKCIEFDISYHPYIVPTNSITVPYIENSDDIFILRQSYDVTAIVDESYCSDKFNFYELMKDTGLTPKTFISSSTISVDTLTSIENNGNTPNIIKKYRHPMYNQKELPAIYSIEDDAQLNSIKDIMDLDNELLQEFIYDESNIVDNRYTVIRSIDIIYGPELDVVNMGGGNPISMLKLIQTCELICNSKLSINFLEKSKLDSLTTNSDTSYLKSLVSSVRFTSHEEGLEETVKWSKDSIHTPWFGV